MKHPLTRTRLSVLALTFLLTSLASVTAQAGSNHRYDNNNRHDRHSSNQYDKRRDYSSRYRGDRRYVHRERSRYQDRRYNRRHDYRAPFTYYGSYERSRHRNNKSYRRDYQGVRHYHSNRPLRRVRYSSRYGYCGIHGGYFLRRDFHY